MAAMGVPAAGGGNELDCRLRDELDDGCVLRQRLRPPLWKGDSDDGRPYFSARPSRFCGTAHLLAHPVVDVPQEDFPEDLSSIQLELVPTPRPKSGAFVL